MSTEYPEIDGVKYEIEYQVVKLSEMRRDDEFYMGFKKRSRRSYGPRYSDDDRFDTKKEAIKFGLEKYGHSEFTIVEVYSKAMTYD